MRTVSFHHGCLLAAGLFACLMSRNLAHYTRMATVVVTELQGQTAPEAVATAGDGNGWKNIHVFFGDEQHLPPPRTPVKSQCQQDELVLALLHQKPNGYFLDLAANDAVHLSNTYNLEVNRIWTGICVEPNPSYWRRLSYRKCQIAAAVVGKNRLEEVQFIMHANARQASGGIVGDNFDNKESKPKTDAKPVKLYTVPLLEVLQRLSAPKVLDYFSLDVEGAETFVMKDFPFEEYQFKVLTVERPKQDLIDLLYENGYVYLAGFLEYGEETIWAKASNLDSLDLAALESFPKWMRNSTKYLQVGAGSFHEKPTLQHEAS